MQNKFTKGGIAAAIVMGVLTVILLPVLIINITLIIKGNMGGVAPPDVFGIAPLAVTSGSMEGDNPDSFDEGALIFVDILTDEEKQGLAEGDIVTYYITNDDGSIAYVTHRILIVNRSNGNITGFTTQGDANNVPDRDVVPVENVVGKCVGSVGGIGAFAMFLQSPGGIIVFVGIPVVAFIAYDAVRITINNRKAKAQSAVDETIKDKDAEIARLRALVEQQNAEPAAQPPEQSESSGGDDGQNENMQS